MRRSVAVTAGVSATNVDELRLLVRRAVSLKSPAMAVTVHEAAADFYRVNPVAVVGVWRRPPTAHQLDRILCFKE
jgi:hypothetical protein